MLTRTAKNTLALLILAGISLPWGSAETVGKKFVVNEVLEGANLNNQKGIRNFVDGRYIDALDEFQSALGEYERIDHQEGYISALQNQGLVYFAMGQDSNANVNFLEALRRSQLLGYKKGQADSYHKLGNVWMERGQYDDALKHFDLARVIYQEIRDSESTASLLNSLGACQLQRGKAEDLGLAETNFINSAKLNRQLKKYPGLSANYLNLSQVAIRKNNLSLALTHAFEALSIDKQIEDSKSIGESLNTLGRIYESMGKKELAFLYHERAYGTSRALEFQKRQLTDLENLLRLAGALGLQAKKTRYEEDLILLKNRLSK